MDTPTITKKNYHNSPITCLQCTLMGIHNYKFENCGFLLDQHYLLSFWSDLCQYLSIISTRCTTDKTLKETVHLFKKNLHPSTAPLPNVRIKRASEVYPLLYNNIIGKICPNSNVQKNSQEKYTLSYIKCIQIRTIKSITTAHALSS